MMFSDLPHGEIWFAPIPRCPTHGQMKFDAKASLYVCMGYDGEGCDFTIPDDGLEWSPLGTVD